MFNSNREAHTGAVECLQIEMVSASSSGLIIGERERLLRQSHLFINEPDADETLEDMTCQRRQLSVAILSPEALQQGELSQHN